MKMGRHQHRGAGVWGWEGRPVVIWSPGCSGRRHEQKTVGNSRLGTRPLIKSKKGPGEASRRSRNRLTWWCSWEDCESWAL